MEFHTPLYIQDVSILLELARQPVVLDSAMKSQKEAPLTIKKQLIIDLYNIYYIYSQIHYRVCWYRHMRTRGHAHARMHTRTHTHAHTHTRTHTHTSDGISLPVKPSSSAVTA